MNDTRWLAFIFGISNFIFGFLVADSGFASHQGTYINLPKWAGYGMMVAGVAMILVGFLSKKK